MLDDQRRNFINEDYLNFRKELKAVMMKIRLEQKNEIQVTCRFSGFVDFLKKLKTGRGKLTH